jgi:precorrin-8X/cobalt-precorrin-8 methylmutase
MTHPKIQPCPPEEIESRSMAVIEAEIPEPRPFAGVEWLVVRRMIHTTADFELLDNALFHPRAIEAGLDALAAGCTVFTDTEMARMGIPMRRMSPLGCEVRCLINDSTTAELAAQTASTRTAAAVDLALREHGLGPDSIYVVGNAPTALVRLVEHIEAGRAAPALVVGVPVGFVNAAESKELLMAQDDVPYVTIRGRKGGSALGACVVNQLAHCLLAQRTGEAG